MNCQLKTLSVLVLSAWTLPVLALDLGRLQISSAIGEPLRAEVDIAQASPDELRSLRAHLAAPDSFHQAGMEFNPALTGVTATLQARSNGTPFIALTGKKPIQENFIDLILETQWATGRLVKNYALLLTSVNDRASAPSPSVTSSTRSPSTAEPVSPVTVQRVPAPPASTSEATSALNPLRLELNAQRVPVYTFSPGVNPAPTSKDSVIALTSSQTPVFKKVDSVPSANSTRTGHERESNTIEVKPGDTASTLAMKHLAAHVSLDQMLLALLNANPDAFIQGNVNLIKAGAILKLPTAAEATQISRAEARQTVMAQSRDFAEYGRRLADSPMSVGSHPSREVMGKVTPETTDGLSNLPQQDKLTLSKSQVNTHSAEATLAAEREAKDAAEQMQALKKNLKDLEVLAKGQNPSGKSADTASSNPAVAPQATDHAAPTPPLAASHPPSSLSQIKALSEGKDAWLWGSGVLAVLLIFAFLIRKKTRPSEDVYAPSYNDSPEPPIGVPPAPAMEAPDLSAQMASIDLNLPTHGTSMDSASAQAVNPTSSSTTPVTSENTEQSKLTLAAQLLAQGDQDLARTLILSVASTATGDLKSRALQMLGQIR